MEEMRGKTLHIGTCGWSRFPEKGDRLINYAKVFDVVEINSTFYKLPMERTAERWRMKVDKIKDDFIFIVKAPREITHIDRFKTGLSIEMFNKTKKIMRTLRTNYVLFQTPKSFKPTEENIRNVRNFFSSIDRENTAIFWEVRWEEEWKKEVVEKLFSELNINQAIDPLRQTWSVGRYAYFRLHGFGDRMMYSYKFRYEELRKLCNIVNDEVKRREVFLFFNNTYMYEDAMAFIDICKNWKTKEP